MAKSEPDFQRTHPLGDLGAIAGNSKSNSDVNLSVSRSLSMCQLFAADGKETALMKKFGFKGLPGVAEEKRDFIALPVTIGEWMLISKKDDGPDFGAGIAKKAGASGYLSELSDSRVRFSISGPKARELMSRGCRLDLHESMVSKGYCAQTVIAQVGVILHVSSAAPTFELYVYSGFARSFWHWLSHSAEQFSWSFSAD